MLGEISLSENVSNHMIQAIQFSEQYKTVVTINRIEVDRWSEKKEGRPTDKQKKGLFKDIRLVYVTL